MVVPQKQPKMIIFSRKTETPIWLYDYPMIFVVSSHRVYRDHTLVLQNAQIFHKPQVSWPSRTGPCLGCCWKIRPYLGRSICAKSCHCPVSVIDSIQKFTSFALILLDSGDYFTRVLSWLRLSIRKASTITLMTIHLAIMCVCVWIHGILSKFSLTHTQSDKAGICTAASVIPCHPQLTPKAMQMHGLCCDLK